jgi:hypothetical protein
MNVIERFERKIIKADSGCWIWIGGQTRGNYGEFGFNGSIRRAHRVAWVLYRGEIPDGLCVLHHCDVRLCVNPDHLFLGTKKENTHDAMQKGRLAFGERNGSSKLRKSQVQDILASKGTHTALAKTFGVSTAQIHNIRSGKHWNRVKAKRGQQESDYSNTTEATP